MNSNASLSAFTACPVGPVYCSLHRQETWRRCFCPECRRRAGNDRRDEPSPQAFPGARVMSRVLIVEDEAHLAKGLRFNLEAEGHWVQVVGDGENALELLLGRDKNGGKGHGEEFDAV